MNNLDKRLIIIKCLKKWRQSYQLSHHLYKNVDELNKCINEITGIEKMTWFVPSIEGDRQIHSECKELNFDPFLELKLISELKNFKNIDEMNLFWDDIERKISTSLYQINLDKFNSVITITDISLRRVQLVEILLICNNIYYKTHESKKESYLSIAKECRKKDIIIDWWCEKWLLKDKERSVNYSLFPIEFNSLKKEFLFVSKIDIIEVNPFNLDLLLKNFHSKEYIQTVKYNNKI